MTPDFTWFLIAAVFGSQVIVLSFLTPLRRRRNFARLLTHYPPEEYPRLYPVPKQQMQRRLSRVMPLHYAVGAIAALTLVIGLKHQVGSLELSRRLLCCLMAQMLPAYLNTPWMIKVARQFRAMPPPAVRSAQLRPWRICDFVSPLWIGIGLGAQLLALGSAVIAYLHRSQALLVAAFCTILSSALLLRMLWRLLGRAAFPRSDPYMSAPDLFRARQLRFRLLFQGGAALGVYLAFVVLNQAQLVHLDFRYVIAAVSVAVQLIWFASVAAQGRALATRDFSVYRAETGPQVVR